MIKTCLSLKRSKCSQKYFFHLSRDDDKKNELSVAENGKPRDAGVWRDLTAYWILGLCNNFGYVVMLTAAHDIIGGFEKTNVGGPSVSFMRHI